MHARVSGTGRLPLLRRLDPNGLGRPIAQHHQDDPDEDGQGGRQLVEAGRVAQATGATSAAEMAAVAEVGLTTSCRETTGGCWRPPSSRSASGERSAGSARPRAC